MKRNHVFEFYNHRITISFDDTPGRETNGIGMEFTDDQICIVEAPCSVPLSIVNGFQFMLENNVQVLVMDGTEIRRIT